MLTFKIYHNLPLFMGEFSFYRIFYGKKLHGKLFYMGNKKNYGWKLSSTAGNMRTQKNYISGRMSTFKSGSRENVLSASKWMDQRSTKDGWRKAIQCNFLVIYEKKSPNLGTTCSLLSIRPFCTSAGIRAQSKITLVIKITN